MNIRTFLCAFFFCYTLSAATLENIVVFGDSLSDNGNLYRYLQDNFPQEPVRPSSPPYYQGRFSNGLVWIEQLASLFYSPLRDYARGGAVVSKEISFSTLAGEIQDYLFEHGGEANKKSLYIFLIGANNYLYSSTLPQQKVKTVVQQIRNDIQQLVERGAKYIMLINLPDLSKMPFAKRADAQQELSQVTQAHNQALAQTRLALQIQNPKALFLYYDVYTLVNRMRKNAASLGFTNIEDACTEIEPEELQVPSCPGYLFFDALHPTHKAHRIIAKQIKTFLLQKGIHFIKARPNDTLLP